MTHEPGVLLAIAARSMMAQDARWVTDAVLSSTGREDMRGVIPLLLLGHSARITHEGSIALRSRDPNVGISVFADLLPDQQSPLITRARHATKLLDDSAKTFDDLLGEMADYYAQHHAAFTGKAVPLARWLECDLGLFLVEGRPLAGTIPLQFRFGAPPTLAISQLHALLYDVSVELGGALAILAAADGDGSPPSSTVDYRTLGRVSSRDRKAAKYLDARYDPALPIEAKLLLLMAEGEASTTCLVLPHTESSHQEAVFRARVVSLFHALSAVDRILNRYPSAQSSRTRVVRELVSDTAAQRFLHDPGLRRVRNRCMHYEIRDPTVALDLSAPMFGLVESQFPGYSFDQLNIEATGLVRRIADVLASW